MGVTSSDLYDGLSATTLQGSDVTIMVTGGVMINDANVIVADVLASNGIVHVIDAVLIPGGDGETPDSVTVSCGNPANNNCLDDYCSPNDELHEVRCCSDSQIDNYQQRNDCEVWAESQFLSVGEGGDGCVHDAPLVTAIEVCMMEGARLCTVEEIQGACTAGTGCGHDADMVWTSAQCSNDGDLPSIVDIAISDDSFSTLVAAVVAADLVDVLAGDGTFTGFAPTNDAFTNLPEGTLDSLLQPENVQQLTDILLYHVLGSVVTSSDLYDGLSATTLQGSDVTIMVTGGVMINDANVIVADVLASNGIVHVIDAVLIPGGDGQCPSDLDESGSVGFGDLLVILSLWGPCDGN